MKMQTQLRAKPLTQQLADAPEMPLPHTSTPFYKNKKCLIIMIVVLLLLVAGSVGLIVAFSASNVCMSVGLNTCSCDGVEFPIFIDGDSVKFGNLTFSESDVTRLKTVNGNNTDTTYSIFEEIDSHTLKCESTLGKAEVAYNSTTTVQWDGQLKDGQPLGYGLLSVDKDLSGSDDVNTIMLNGKVTGLAMGVFQTAISTGFVVYEVRNWLPNGLGTVWNPTGRGLIINVKLHNDDAYDITLTS